MTVLFSCQKKENACRVSGGADYLGNLREVRRDSNNTKFLDTTYKAEVAVACSGGNINFTSFAGTREFVDDASGRYVFDEIENSVDRREVYILAEERNLRHTFTFQDSNGFKTVYVYLGVLQTN